MNHVSELMGPIALSYCAEASLMGSPCLIVSVKMLKHFYRPKFECGCCEMLVFRVCGVRQYLYVFSLYCNPDLDDWIFDCLLASIVAMQAEDVRASFLFLGDLIGHHQEWLGLTTTNRHGVAAFDFATVSGCDQLVVGPTHPRGGTLDLMMTDVRDIVWVAVVAPIGNSDHSQI